MKPLPPPTVYTVSPGRSGSRMMARVLDLHPGIRGIHEPGDKPTMTTLTFDAWAGRATPTEVARALARRPRAQRRRGRDDRVWVESAFWYSMLIPFLSGRFVHLVRPARDFIRSGLSRPWYTDRQTDEWRAHQLEPPEELTSRPERVAWLWSEYHGRILRDLEAVPEADRIRVVVGAGPIDWSALVEGFLGLDLQPEVLQSMRGVEETRPGMTLSAMAPWTEEAEAAYERLCAPIERLLERSTSV